MNCSVKFCHSTIKVNQALESQTPPYLPNGEGLWWAFHTIGFKTLENGGVGHLQIPKKNTAMGSKCRCNPKTPNLLYLPNPKLLAKNNFTISFRTHENGGVGHLKTFKFFHN
jgi:hypothetical protein